MRYFRVWLRRYAESIISMYTIWPILICNQYGPTHIPPSCSHYVSDDVLFADSYYEINEHETLWYGIWTATNIYIIVVISIRCIYRKLRLLENFQAEIRSIIVNYVSYTYICDSIVHEFVRFATIWWIRWRFVDAVFKNLVCETCRFTGTCRLTAKFIFWFRTKSRLQKYNRCTLLASRSGWI